MIPEKIIFVGVLINLITYFLYIKSIFRGGTRPNLISWFIWMLAPFLGFFFQLKAGAGLSSLSVFMVGFGPLLVITFSLFKKNAFWKIRFFDVVCGIFSLLALALYLATKNLVVSIVLVMLGDFLAYIPTFVKSWKYPETESSSIYFGGIIINILSLLIIKNWIFAIYSFPIYLIFGNSIEIFLIYRKKLGFAKGADI